MDVTKDHAANLELHLHEKSDNETVETKEERQPSPVTLHKKEIIESDENGHLLRRETDPEALESVHRYAKRIKSFLGWEPNIQDQEQSGKEKDRSINDKNSVSNPDGDPQHDSKDENLTGEKEIANSEKILSEGNQDESRNGEESSLPNENSSDLVNIPAEVQDNLKENVEVVILTEDIGENHKTTQRDNHENPKNSIESDNKNYSDIDNQGDMTEKNEVFPKTENSNNNVNNPEKDEQSIESVPISKSDSNNPEEDLPDTLASKMEDKDKSNNLINGIALDNLQKYPADETLIEHNILVENQKFDDSPSQIDDPNVTDLENSISFESGPNKQTNESTKQNGEIRNYERKNSINKMDEADEIISSNSITETDALKENKTENICSDSKEITSPTKNNADNENNDEKRNEDLKREDSVYLDENIPFKNNIKKPYMDEIRRLSLDIVKDVIESARNSVHEVYVHKNEEKNATGTTDILENTKENEISKFSNGNKCSEVNTVLENENAENKNNAFDEKVSLDYRSKELKEHFELRDNMDHPVGIIDYKDNTVDDDTVCGYGCFKPKWIQRFAQPVVFLILFSIVGVVHGNYYAYFVSIMSTLEKRYAFRTKVSGTLLLADEVTPLILGIIVGYFGGRTHRPRMVAIGMFMSAACCFLSGLPYLMYGTAKHLTFVNFKNETGPEICRDGIENSLCESNDLPPTLTVVGIFLLASFLKGFATLSYYVIGISYMDDNIKKKNSPLYLAIALALRLLGPLVGFLMSSGFLKFYENPVDDPGFGPDDPRWIGAWWIGFFLQGVLLVIFTLPIALFPRRLPGQKRMEKTTSPANEDNLKQIFLGLTSALKRLGKNPVFVLLIINTTMKVFGHFGHAIMLPKYMENQFRLSASEASLFSGATSITCVMISTVFGGFLIWKFRPRIKVLLFGMITSEMILSIGFLILMIPRCQTTDMLHFGMDKEGLILDNVCNHNCDCSTTSFTPFCGPDGKTTYFSPCYAGCTHEMTLSATAQKNKEFGNCSCVSDTAGQQMGSTISEGFCPDDNCWTQTIMYLVILFFMVTTSNLFTVAHTMILLRSVHPNDKSVALGTFETFICLFGFIPFPVAFGALVDSACLVWEKSCGETGNCWFYDMEKYDYLLHGVASLFCFLSVVCLIILYFLSSRVRDLYVDEDEEEQYVDIKLDTVSGSVTKL